MENINELLDDKYQELNFSEQFEYQGILGKGSYGTVIQAMDLNTKKVCAIKVSRAFIKYNQQNQIIIRKNVTQQEFELLRSEAQILSQLKHKNIVGFHRVIQSSQRILIVMDVVRGGTLQQLMEKREEEKRWFSEADCQTLLHAILQPLSYIHSLNIVHRDLKPENILIEDENDLSTVRISDFGLSYAFCQEFRWNTLQKQCGTLMYMAPELLEARVYGKSVDIWSVGVIMFRLLQEGAHPYYNEGEDEEVLRLRVHQTHKAAQKLTKFQSSLFVRLTMVEASHRYTAQQGLEHPWLKNDLNAEVPQTIEEIFLGWRLGQKLVMFIKALMVLKVMGWVNPNLNTDEEYNKKCQVVSLEAKSKKPAHLQNKEFYDKLFSEYASEVKELRQQFELAHPPKTPPKRDRLAFIKELLSQQVIKEEPVLLENLNDSTFIITLIPETFDQLAPQDEMQTIQENITKQISGVSILAEESPKRRPKQLRVNKIQQTPRPPRYPLSPNKKVPQSTQPTQSPLSPTPIPPRVPSNIEVEPFKFKISLKPIEKLSILPSLQTSKQDKDNTFNFTSGPRFQIREKRTLSTLFEQKQTYSSRQYRHDLRKQVYPPVLDLSSGFANHSNSPDSLEKRVNQFAGMYNYPIMGTNDNVFPIRMNKMSNSVRKPTVNMPDIPSERLFKFLSQFVKKK